MLRKPRWTWRFVVLALAVAGSIGVIRFADTGPLRPPPEYWEEVRRLSDGSPWEFEIPYPKPARSILQSRLLGIEVFAQLGWYFLVSLKDVRMGCTVTELREIALDFGPAFIEGFERPHAGWMPVHRLWRGQLCFVAAWLPATLLCCAGAVPSLVGLWRTVRMRRRWRRGHCACCNYPLIGLPEPRCPECGLRAPWTK